MRQSRMVGLIALVLTLGLGMYGALRASAQNAPATGSMPGMQMGEKAAAPEEGKSMDVTAEVLDLSCFAMEGAHGKDHQACAATCLKNGSPLGLLTSDGKVYLVVNHGDDAAVKALRGKAAETVKVTGAVYHRGGLLSIEIKNIDSGAAPAPAAGAPAAK